ncbi:MAG: hypothetical protein ACYS17_13665 [Planctomycetota bacterium]
MTGEKQEGRTKFDVDKTSDIGQAEAYTVNLKKEVASESDIAGRSRVVFDAMAINMATSFAAINATIVQTVKQSVVTAGKNDENVIGINETDAYAANILNSPWAEAMKSIALAVVSEATQKKKT